jgi:hypothetical protein
MARLPSLVSSERFEPSLYSVTTRYCAMIAPPRIYAILSAMDSDTPDQLELPIILAEASDELLITQSLQVHPAGPSVTFGVEVMSLRQDEPDPEE